MKKLIGAFLPLSLFVMITAQQSCSDAPQKADAGDSLIRLITLAPGHFHAALVQKYMYDNVSPDVHVYAPEGQELQSHLGLINQYNTRADNPASWNEILYTGTDFFDKMLSDKAGNVVVIAGNNKEKTDYIKKSIDAGLNVLADKPMAIDATGFNKLKEAFAAAEKNKVLLYDIMTERFEINSILQREFTQMPELFGELEKGTPDNPAVIKESVHHFYKQVSGKPLVRPAWYMDVAQEGNGIVDVTTHMVDIIQWSCFPEQTLDYQQDVVLHSAKRWATELTPSQFKQITQLDVYPDFLQKDVKDSILHVFANGEINYALKGVNAKVVVIWNFQAPEGTGDTHFSMMRGTKASLFIRQGKEQQYKPTLYIEPAKNTDLSAFEKTLQNSLATIHQKYPGVEAKKYDKGWEIVIPQQFKVGHEEHFAEVAKNFLQYLEKGNMPAWEVPNMIAKYYTTTQALEKSMAK